MAAVRRRLEEFDATVVVIDAHDAVRAERFRKAKLGDDVPVLADPTARVAGAYGVARRILVHAEWVSAPSVFIVDTKGVLRWAHRGGSWNDRPEIDAILDELNGLK